MKYSKLLEEVKEEVTQYFITHQANQLPFHNFAHTTYIVAKASEIGKHYQLNEKDFFVVVAAAWFHDTGYLSGPVAGHEDRSAALANNFLRSKGLDEPTLKLVEDCISVTRMPQQPVTLLEQIICDADLFNLGTDRFPEMNKKMKKETGIHTGKKISKEAWRRVSLDLLEQHKYHTDYAKDLLDKKKSEHMESLRNKEAANHRQNKEADNALKDKKLHHQKKAEDETEEMLFEESSKSKKPSRGIETMFRISAANHQRLSDMADNKANIMITTTSIILSILLSVLLRKLEDNQHLVIPAIMLLGVCVVSLVFAIRATRPRVPSGRFTQTDVDAKKSNLLFFGNYYKMDYEVYQEGIKKMMNDSEFLYASLTRDLYTQGLVLGSKYRLLRTGYNIFMYGVVISVLAFIIASLATL